MAERLQKALARAGLASRRQADRWVEQGRVTVNGRTAVPGTRINPGDRIALDGEPLDLPNLSSPTLVLAYHKPEGELSSRRDSEGRPTVFGRLPELEDCRWIQVGRLDLNSSGLLLFTNDGDLANALMHPSREVEREYRVRVRGRPDAAILDRLRQGITLEDGPAHFDSVEILPGKGKNAQLRVVLGEGRKREVRRLLEAVGHPVSRLLRVRYGPVTLPRDLKPGQWRELSSDEVAELRRAVGF
ncbi:pseudouridine synthase [Thiohalorhabdus sp.]|uniref:pseudouridine synthase n=1 Tax=Thiohalorhabdus sp. TaxID=3094134 RepID=UPI002FC27528